MLAYFAGVLTGFVVAAICACWQERRQRILRDWQAWNECRECNAETLKERELI